MNFISMGDYLKHLDLNLKENVFFRGYNVLWITISYKKKKAGMTEVSCPINSFLPTKILFENYRAKICSVKFKKIYDSVFECAY